MNFNQIILDKFRESFPDCWAKLGEEFNNGGAVIWSGEDSLLNGRVQAFNYHSQSNSYEFGVHLKLVRFAKKHNCYWEAYDSGTFLMYLI